MKTELLTFQSNDFVEYFPYLCNDEIVEPTGNCEGRSIRASQIANLDISFGTLYFLNETDHKDPFYSPNSMRIYCYHCWNRSGDNLFDSVKQLEANGLNAFYHPVVGEQVLLIDGSYLQYLLNQKGSKNKLIKYQTEVSKLLKKMMREAHQVGVRFVYLENFAWKPSTGFYVNTTTYKINIEIAKKEVEKVFSKVV
jgi:hypothetical protein